MLCCETCSTQRLPSSSSAPAITAAPPPQLTEPKGSASRCPSVTGVPQKPKAELDTAKTRAGGCRPGLHHTAQPSFPARRGGRRDPKASGGTEGTDTTAAEDALSAEQPSPTASPLFKMAAGPSWPRPPASPSPWQRGLEPAREGAELRPALAGLPGWAAGGDVSAG